MTKRLVAKTGTYTNQQGEQKGEYTRIGVLMDGENGQYMLLDPTVNLAGVLAKQNVMAANEGKPMRDSVMISVFENDNQNQGQGQQQYQQPPQQQGGWGQPQQPQQQQYQQPQQSNQPPF